MSWFLTARNEKLKVIFLVVVFVTSLALISSFSSFDQTVYWLTLVNDIHQEKSVTRKDLQKQQELETLPPIARKKIYFATKWRNCPKCRHFIYIEYASQYCPKCIFTEDLSDYNSSDAVVFHGRYLGDPPKYRNPNQIWIYMLFENSVVQQNVKYPQGFKNAFDWTMTYRRDSDIFCPYGGFEPYSTGQPEPLSNDRFSYHLQGKDFELFKTPSLEELRKKKLAAWTVSRCSSHGKREVIIKEMSQYMEIDIFGKCGPKKCNMEGIDDCKFEIAKTYKFYLAFENAVCEDYVTEKYFTTLLTEMVPVVYGGANYSAFFPPKSYINIADFDSVKDLADYLTFLDNTPSEYLKYFEWRKSYRVFNNRFTRGWCDVCNKLWETDIPNKVYKDAKQWWKLNSSGKNSSCVLPTKLDWDVFKDFKWNGSGKEKAKSG